MINEIPLAIATFQKRLLVGVGKILRMYEMGKRKLLRKCENKNFPTHIQSIQVNHDRIIVGDVQEALHYVIYKRQTKELEIFADNSVPRFVTATCILDYDSTAVADKFGNIAISRLPADVSSGVTAAHSRILLVTLLQHSC